MITLSRVREVVDYDPVTGVFRWKIITGRNPHGYRIGDVAGQLTDRYTLIGIDGRKYYAHRLAWFHTYGVWPPSLDHRDLNKRNNVLANLRLATPGQNNANNHVYSSNRLGIKGVRYHTDCDRYEARIAVNGKRIGLGFFPTVEQAHAAYLEAAKQYYGEFARGK